MAPQRREVDREQRSKNLCAHPASAVHPRGPVRRSSADHCQTGAKKSCRQCVILRGRIADAMNAAAQKTRRNTGKPLRDSFRSLRLCVWFFIVLYPCSITTSVLRRCGDSVHQTLTQILRANIASAASDLCPLMSDRIVHLERAGDHSIDHRRHALSADGTGEARVQRFRDLIRSGRGRESRMARIITDAGDSSV